MKKTASILLIFCLGLSWVRAEDHSSHLSKTLAAQENQFRNALWYNSSNRAGLAFQPIAEYNCLDLEYGCHHGGFRPQTVGAGSSNVSLDTEGAVRLGDFMVCGDFSFRNIFEKGALYNTALYEVSENMPFFIMDGQESNWNKQEYQLGASLTTPVIRQRISFGLQINYITKVGAKQKDPRSETYKYSVQVIPSLAIRLGKNHLMGLHGLFNNQFERSNPSLNNYAINQEVIYNKGLGEGIMGVVGGNGGVKTLYYKGMDYGGGLQYSYLGESQLLADFDCTVHSIEGYENPTLPKRLGSSKEMAAEGMIQLLTGRQKSDKFTLHARLSGTDGLEYVQRKNEEAFNQKWETLKINEMSKFKRAEISLDYDHLFGNDPEKGYDWKIGGAAAFSHRNYSYSVPHSTFTASNLLFGANGGKQFKFRTSTLLLGLDLGYQLNLSGSYQYGGKKKDSIQVTYYQLENDYLTSDFMKLGGRISYTLHSKKVNYFLNLTGDWRKAFSIPQQRLVCQASVGIVF